MKSLLSGKPGFLAQISNKIYPFPFRKCVTFPWSEISIVYFRFVEVTQCSKMKSYLINSLFLFISVSLISCISGTSEPLTYEIKPDEAAFVMLQLKSQELKQDSTQYQAEIKHAVDEVHKANVNLGYTQLEKSGQF